MVVVVEVESVCNAPSSSAPPLSTSLNMNFELHRSSLVLYEENAGHDKAAKSCTLPYFCILPASRLPRAGA